jgi:hypothetical protein
MYGCENWTLKHRRKEELKDGDDISKASCTDIRVYTYAYHTVTKQIKNDIRIKYAHFKQRYGRVQT